LPDYYRAVKSVQSSLVSARRPRDYNISAINGASLHFTTGETALLLRLWAAEHYEDSGNLPLARGALADAERIYDESASGISADLQTSLVIGSVVIRHDAASARMWWQKMHSKNPPVEDTNYWLAKTAFHWADNELGAARIAWQTGLDYLAKLPDVGSYNFDRDCYRLMDAILAAPPEPVHNDSSHDRETPLTICDQ
jgi:hypothetical protein